MTTPDTAIVTGGSAGIGAAIAKALLDAGYEVVSLDLRKPAWSHERLHALEVDLTDADATREAAGEVAGRFAISHLVHNAGVIRPNLIEAAEPEDIQTLAKLHLGAPLILLKALLPGMKARAHGRVILLSSRAAQGGVTRTAYSATKAGIIGMARTWALELAPHGITANVVAPGPVGSTEMFHAVIPAGSEQERALARSIPMGRLGKPEDVADAVLFFASPNSSFVTGQTLYVCGGSSVGTVPV
jgi:NAD(P)-dependent dehydrogenase (short-subunit alcohol dehydrogenase family)